MRQDIIDRARDWLADSDTDNELYWQKAGPLVDALCDNLKATREAHTMYVSEMLELTRSLHERHDGENLTRELYRQADEVSSRGHPLRCQSERIPPPEGVECAMCGLHQTDKTTEVAR